MHSHYLTKIRSAHISEDEAGFYLWATVQTAVLAKLSAAYTDDGKHAKPLYVPEVPAFLGFSAVRHPTIPASPVITLPYRTKSDQPSSQYMMAVGQRECGNNIQFVGILREPNTDFLWNSDDKESSPPVFLLVERRTSENGMYAYHQVFTLSVPDAS